MRTLSLLCASLLALAVPAAAAAPAAPAYVSSDPADGAEVHETPAEVVVRFSEPLDPASTLVVRDRCGKRLDSGQVEVVLNEVRVALAEERAGRHTVTYRAVGLGGLTGSTEGRFSYLVHLGPSCRKGGGGRAGHGGHGDHGDHGGHRAGGDRRSHPAAPGHGGHGAPWHGAGGGPVHGAHGAPGETAHRDHGGPRGAPAPRPEGAAAPDEVAAAGTDGGPGEPLGAPGTVQDATGAALAAALVAAAAIGALGGWMLRVTGTR